MIKILRCAQDEYVFLSEAKNLKDVMRICSSTIKGRYFEWSA